MLEINIYKLKVKDLRELDSLSVAFVEYLETELKMTHGEAEYVAGEDFKNPYCTPYIAIDYEDTVKVGKATYKVYRCWTDFNLCGLFQYSEATPFEFYMLLDEASMPDGTEGSYINAVKKYVW